MPRLNRSLIREWLVDQDKTVRWLAGETGIPNGALANALCPSADPLRAGRVRAISRVTGLPEAKLVAAEDEQEGVKEEKTHPDKRNDQNKGGRKGPKRLKGAAA